MKAISTLKKRLPVLELLAMLLAVSISVQAQIPSSNLRILNIEKGANSAKFSVYLKNTSASSFVFSGCQLVIDFNKEILKDQNGDFGTPTLSVLASGLADSLQPRNPSVITSGSTGMLRFSPGKIARIPGGANNAPAIAAGDSLLLGTFKLQSSHPYFKAGEELNLAWRTSSSPFTKVGGYLANVNTEIQSGMSTYINTFSSSINFTALIEAMYDGSSMVPDTITVSLRKVSAPYDVVDMVRVLTNANGLATLSFKHGVEGQSYYLVVNHRNSIETWSADGGLALSASNNYDMTSAQDKAYGSNLVQVGSKWCIYSGDVNQDGEVGSLDMNEVDNGTAAFLTGYEPADVNGDQEVGALDMNYVDNNSSAFISSIKPGAKKATRPVQQNAKKTQVIAN